MEIQQVASQTNPQGKSLQVPSHRGIGNGQCDGAGMVVPETKVKAFLREGGRAVTCLLCHMMFIGRKPSD